MSAGQVVVIRGEHRSTGTGHRVTVDGVPPQATRERPPWRWPAELRDRRRAKLIGKWTREAA